MLLEAFRQREQQEEVIKRARGVGVGPDVERVLRTVESALMTAYPRPRRNLPPQNIPASWAAVPPRPSSEEGPSRRFRDDLVEGEAVIRIIEDVAELERLCRRAAPGADGPVGFGRGMTQLVSREFIVDSIGHARKSYRISDDDRSWSIPFDACSVVRSADWS